MATIERRKSHGNTVFYAKVRRKGQTQAATFSKLSDAKAWAQKVEADILAGKVSPPKYTLSDLLERYLAEVLPQKNPSTIPSQRLQLLWWKRHLGNCHLADITPARILDCRMKLKKRSNGTINRYMAVLSHVFSIAIEWKWCRDNPVRKVRKLREPKGRTRFLSNEERQRLLEACKASRNKHLYVLVVLALSTGARRGELLGLRWRDVDLQRGTLTFHHTKNGEIRTVPLTGLALDLMRQQCRCGSLVFPGQNGQTPIRFRSAWETALGRARLTDFCWHDMRHDFASNLAMLDIGLITIAEILGHKTLSMVKRYAHLSEAHTLGVVERMNRQYLGNKLELRAMPKAWPFLLLSWSISSGVVFAATL